MAGITSVLLVMMLSAPRVFLAMARDGMVPPKLLCATSIPKFRTPWKSTILIGVFVAMLAGLLPIDALLHMTNIGTLFAFVIVCAAVLIMRRTNPDAERPFRAPFYPFVPILGILSCLLLMFSLPVENWYRLIIWMAHRLRHLLHLRLQPQRASQTSEAEERVASACGWRGALKRACGTALRGSADHS